MIAYEISTEKEPNVPASLSSFLPARPPSPGNPQYHHKAFGLKGSVQVSAIIKIIWTVSERRTDGLAKDYGPGIHIDKLSQTRV